MTRRFKPLFFIGVVAAVLVVVITGSSESSSKKEEDFPSIEVLVNPKTPIHPPRTMAPKLSGWPATDQCYPQGKGAEWNPAIISQTLADLLKAGPMNAPHFLLYSWNCQVWVLLDYRAQADPQAELCVWLFQEKIPESDIGQIRPIPVGGELRLPICSVYPEFSGEAPVSASASSTHLFTVSPFAKIRPNAYVSA